MFRRATLFIVLAALSCLQPRAEGCGDLVAGHAQWASPEAVALRVRFLLQAELATLMRRSDPEYREREASGAASVEEAITKFAGPAPTLALNAYDMVYRHEETGAEVHVAPVEGIFRVYQRREGALVPVGLDGLSCTRCTYSFRGTVPGFTDRFVTNLATARAFARHFVQVVNRGRQGSILSQMIPYRVARFCDTWQKATLLEGVEAFAGTEPSVFQDGYKVRIVNRETAVTIVDDPEGQYYRMVKATDAGEVYLDAFGRPVLMQDAAGLAKTHFYYGGTETERPTLESAFALLRGETHDGSSTKLVPKPRVAPEEVAAEPVSFQRAMETPDPKQRVAEVLRLDWKTLTADERARMLAKAPTLTNSFEIGAYLHIAMASNDKGWIPVVEGWHDAWRFARTGWQSFKRVEAETALRILRR